MFSEIICHDLLLIIVPDVPGVVILPDGHAVSRSSDFIIYSVEAEFIDRVVAQYGPCMAIPFCWICIWFTS